MDYILPTWIIPLIAKIVIFFVIASAFYKYYNDNEAKKESIDRENKRKNIVYEYDSKSQSEEIEKTKKEDKKDGVYESYYEADHFYWMIFFIVSMLIILIIFG